MCKLLFIMIALAVGWVYHVRVRAIGKGEEWE